MVPCAALLAALLARPSIAATTEAHCPDEPPPAAVEALAGGGLRDLAAPLGLGIGSAVGPHVTAPGAYRDLAIREFNVATVENHMKWAAIHPARDTYDFCAADRIVALARANGMRVRGHTLAWENQNPAWLVAGKFTRDEMVAILHDHIRTVVGHFRSRFPGTVYQWDVVNEPIDDCPVDPRDPRHAAIDAAGGGCGLRHTLWFDRIGPEYVELALRFAREADPDARLFLNEYGLEAASPGALAKRRGLLNVVGSLRAAHVPLDGVGVQLHLGPGGPPAAALRALMRALAAHEVEIAVTELDIGMAAAGPEWVATAADLELQARQYRDVLEACLGTSRCRTFVVWGFSDASTWRWKEQPCMFDRSFQPKPAYQALRQGLVQAQHRLP